MAEPANQTNQNKPPTKFVRALGFMLDVYVVTLAVCSAATWAFYLWIDLRFAGSFLLYALPALWTLSVLLIVILLRRKTSPAIIGALLWPTYMILICAVANAVYFYNLWMHDRIDTSFPFIGALPPIPMCLWIGLALLAWALLTRRRARFTSPNPTPTRRAKIAGLAWLIFCTAFVAASFWVNTYETPPARHADVAVVLGMRVMPDGKASMTLEERTLAAVRLKLAGVVDKIIVSGMIDPFPGGFTQSEALAMKQVCLDHGIAEADIIVDPVGVNTRATVFNARQIMRDHGWTTVVGVSDASHLPRIRMTFKQAGMESATVAARPREWMQADVAVTMREFAGLLIYAAYPSYRPAKIEEMNVKNPRIIVTKSKKTLELFDGETLVKTYKCAIGANDGDKQIEGDLKTPEGHFKIVFKNPKSNFHLSLGLNYPDQDDANRGLKTNPPLITQAEYDMIVRYSKMDEINDEADQNIYWKTKLGGEIFIHGETTKNKSTTLGCVKVTNPEIEELYAVCKAGTPVEIKP